MKNARALIVFARSPVTGKVKTRLTRLLTFEEAADLYRAFLHDALVQYTTLNVDVRLYWANSAPPQIPCYGTSVHRQEGSDLGARMRHAFEQTRDAGYERIVIIGTDHPTLPSEYIRDAFSALGGQPAIAIGPTEDGGYYLLGMAPLFETLFSGIAFSQPDVFVETLKRARRTNARVTILPIWYDVDRPADLKRLVAARDLVPPRTAEVLQELVRTYDL